jgi:hypothetical protein
MVVLRRHVLIRNKVGPDLCVKRKVYLLLIPMFFSFLYHDGDVDEESTERGRYGMVLSSGFRYTLCTQSRRLHM